MMSRGTIIMEHDSAAHESSQAKEADLAEGYRQMAADVEHEMEAEEWAEALIGDVATEEGYVATDEGYVATDEGYGLQPVR
jgi:hypothetical protein